MSRKFRFWRPVRTICLLLLVAGGLTLNGCIFVEHGGHHHHHDDWR